MEREKINLFIKKGLQENSNDIKKRAIQPLFILLPALAYCSPEKEQELMEMMALVLSDLQSESSVMAFNKLKSLLKYDYNSFFKKIVIKKLKETSHPIIGEVVKEIEKELQIQNCLL